LTIRTFQIMSPNHSIFACNENYNIVTFLCQPYHANTLNNQLYLATSPWWDYQLLIKIHPSGHFWFVLTKMHLIIFFNVVATICHVTLVWAFMAHKPMKAQMGGSKLVIEYVFINPFPLYFFHPKAWTKWPCTKLHYDINISPPTHAFTPHL